ncbi:MAG: hypothetical protein E7560_04865 [Ruminococcaceae bacterium]|nr:hypothetical protein [Oscillospiraceae bacterium]
MKLLKNFSLRKLLYNKKFTIPFSIFLAFALWLTIMINEKEIMDRTFTDLTANVNIENTFASENDMSIIGDISAQRFTVLVRGPSYLVGTLTSSDISLYASAATVDAPGEYSLEVAAMRNATNSEYEIISISPSTINVSFDYIDTKEFTITPSALGAVASEGLIAENGVVSGTESNTVTIKGPRAVINKIEKVMAVAEVNKTLSSSATFDANIVLYDEEEKVIDQTNLTLSTQKVKVTVPISKKKTVPVKVEYANLPVGFNKDSIMATVDHPTVTVIGTPETVDKTTHVSLSPIDITTVSAASSSFDVSPKLPEGVRLLDSIDSFTVTLNTRGYIEKTISVSKVEYSGLGSGLKASGATTIQNVKIYGPRAAVNKINATNAVAVLVLTDKKAGEHTVTASIKFEGYDNVWAVGTYNTSVTIK